MKHYNDEYGDLGYDDETERMSHSYDGMLILGGIVLAFWLVVGLAAWWVL